MTAAQRADVDAELRGSGSAPAPTLEAMRDGFAALMATMPEPHGVTTSDTELAGRPALRVEPAEPGRNGVLLYFHGGSWVVGSPRTAITLTAGLVRRTGVSAYSVDYRLAPEHPFPAGIEDATAAYAALLDQGADPANIVLAGDSAGGGLVITSLLLARDRGLPMPAAGVLFSGGLDATRSGLTMTTKEGVDPIFTREALAGTGQLYAPGQDAAQPLLSPAVSADLTGFPPLLLQAGSNELLLDDSVMLAARAAYAGVDVTLDVTGDVPHVFQSYAGRLDEADAAMDRAARFVLDHLA